MTALLDAQDEIERARQFYAAAEATAYLEPAPSTRLEWRRALLALTETEKVLRKAHDMIVAEQEIRLREVENGLQEHLTRLCARIDEVRAKLVAEKP